MRWRREERRAGFYHFGLSFVRAAVVLGMEVASWIGVVGVRGLGVSLSCCSFVAYLGGFACKDEYPDRVGKHFILYYSSCVKWTAYPCDTGISSAVFRDMTCNGLE